STRYWLLRFLEPRKGQIISGQVVREQNGRSFIELDDTLLVVSVSASPPLPLGTVVQVVIGHVDARRDILSVRLASTVKSCGLRSTAIFSSQFFTFHSSFVTASPHYRPPIDVERLASNVRCVRSAEVGNKFAYLCISACTL